MESTGSGVGTGTKLATGVQLGEDQLHPGEPGARLDIDRNTTALVADRDTVVGVENDRDVGAMTRHSLVHAVVNDLPQTVHESAGVRGADVHAGTLPHGFEPLQNREVSRRIVIGGQEKSFSPVIPELSIEGALDTVASPRRGW